MREENREGGRQRRAVERGRAQTGLFLFSLCASPFSQDFSDAEFYEQLAEWIGRPLGALLYLSSRDGVSNAEFHRRCDNKGPTTVIARLRTGYVFGGYTQGTLLGTFAPIALLIYLFYL